MYVPIRNMHGAPLIRLYRRTIFAIDAQRHLGRGLAHLLVCVCVCGVNLVLVRAELGLAVDEYNDLICVAVCMENGGYGDT